MKKIFVFGWTGYLGAAIILRLRQVGVAFMTVGRSRDSDIYLDLANPDLRVLSNFDNGDKFIFLSSISSPEDCARDFEQSYKINVTHTALLVTALLNLGVDVLFSSSDVVYGQTDNVVNEFDEINPDFAYAEMKAEIENKFMDYTNFKVMRLSYVWSLNDKFTKFLLKSHADNTNIEVFHPFVRSVICLDDVIDVVLEFIHQQVNYPKLLNLAGPRFLSRVQIVEAFSRLKPITYTIVYPGDDFFVYRPKQILMQSVYLEAVLKRHPTDVLDAMRNTISDITEGRRDV